MQIVIPTRGRTNQQLTLQSLPRELRQRTTIVCPKREAVRLSCLYEDVKIVVQPDPDWTIARKREWILREWLQAGYDKIIMIDDDCCFPLGLALIIGITGNNGRRANSRIPTY